MRNSGNISAKEREQILDCLIYGFAPKEVAYMFGRSYQAIFKTRKTYLDEVLVRRSVPRKRVYQYYRPKHRRL